MKLTRREFVLLAALGLPLGCTSTRESEAPAPLPDLPSISPPERKVQPIKEAAANEAVAALLKPRRLFDGATVGLISPGGVVAAESDIDEVEENLGELGLNCVRGRHVLDRFGYLAGSDEDRASDLHRMFADKDVDAVLALRGGWGCNRILPLLDYDLIRRNPKILMGYSDITSLLIALYARSGLVTFHGPVGISTWNEFTVEHLRRILYDGDEVMMRNPRRVGPRGPLLHDRIHTIRPGKARGRLVGGNLSVVVSMIGSSYLPDWDGHILFLEDTHEDVYRIDRMLTQLSLAGILPRLAGIVFGKCTDCEAEDPSLTLNQVLQHHVGPLGSPAFSGSMIGHIGDKFTLPMGVEAEIDAGQGTIRLLEPAVL